MSLDSGSVDTTVETVLAGIVADLPKGCARTEKTSQRDCWVIKLIPAKEGAAPISIIVPKPHAGMVTLIAGKGTFFEIPVGGHGYTSFDFPQEVQAICFAVVNRGLKESVTFLGDEVVAGTGTVDLSGLVTVRWQQVILFPRKKRQTRTFAYEPYCG
jgi:hypothetical protein